LESFEFFNLYWREQGTFLIGNMSELKRHVRPSTRKFF